MEEARKNFETAFLAYKTAVHQVGETAYNLLHNPRRGQLLASLEASFNTMKTAATAFDAAT
jgi:hypothetical protein